MTEPDRKPHVPLSDAEKKIRERLLAEMEVNTDDPSDDDLYLSRKAVREAGRDNTRSVWADDK